MSSCGDSLTWACIFSKKLDEKYFSNWGYVHLGGVQCYIPPGCLPQWDTQVMLLENWSSGSKDLTGRRVELDVLKKIFLAFGTSNECHIWTLCSLWTTLYFSSCAKACLGDMGRILKPYIDDHSSLPEKKFLIDLWSQSILYSTRLQDHTIGNWPWFPHHEPETETFWVREAAVGHTFWVLVPLWFIFGDAFLGKMAQNS